MSIENEAWDFLLSRFYVTSNAIYQGNYFLSFFYPHGRGFLPFFLPPCRLGRFLLGFFPIRRGRFLFGFFPLRRGDRGRLSRGRDSLSD